MNTQNQDYKFNLVGIDTETGGLNGYFRCPNTGVRFKGSEHYPLLEISVVVPQCKVSGKGQTLTVDAKDCLTVGIRPYINEDVYEDFTDWAKDNLSEWAFEQHTKSGLLDRLDKPDGLYFDFVVANYMSAEQLILDWLDSRGVKPYDSESRSGAITYGNNINFDLDFIGAKMPNLLKHFHYRKIDVSTINVLSRTVWSGLNIDKPNKGLNHTSLADIIESTEELNLYTNWLNSQGEHHA